MGRILGLDPGTKRVGVALSDLNHLIATPYAVLEADEALAHIVRLIREEEVEAVVIGLPVALAGHEGSAADTGRALDRCHAIDVVAGVREQPLVIEGERTCRVARVVEADRPAHDLATARHHFGVGFAAHGSPSSA